MKSLFLTIFSLTFFALSVTSKLIVHPTNPKLSEHDIDSKRGVKSASTHYHLSAKLFDATKNVVELPEQTLPVRHGTPVLDLEEDQNDVTNLVKELPEQNISEKGKKNTNKKLESFEDDEQSNESQTNDFEKRHGNQLEEDDEHQVLHPPFMTHGEPTRDVHRADTYPLIRSEVTSEDHDIDISSGDYHVQVHKKQNRNFFDANHVQIGTSRLGPHAVNGESQVARFRIKFFKEFQKRPIVLVSTVPGNSASPIFSNSTFSSMGPHSDVFVASISEIRLDSFIVSVIRVDQFPNNGWGQILHLDWVAIEYNTVEYPDAGPNYFPTPQYPEFPTPYQPPHHQIKH